MLPGGRKTNAGKWRYGLYKFELNGRNRRFKERKQRVKG